MLGATWSHNLLIVWKIVMRVKLTIIFLVLIFCVLVIEVYYLKKMPCSFVNIYYTSEPNDFNKAPTSAMVIRWI